MNAGGGAEDRPTGLTGKVVRGVGLAGSGFLLARLITLASYVVLARLITPDELGAYTSGSILVGIGILFAGSGMLAALIHRRDRLDEAASTATAATVLAGIGLALAGVATAPLLGAFFGSSTVTTVAAASAGVLFLQSSRTVPNALLQRRFSFLRRLVVQPAAAIAFGVAAIIATSAGMGVWGLVLGQYVSSIVDFGLSWGLVSWRPRLRQVSLEMWRDLVRYGRHVLAGTAVRRLGDRVPIMVAGGLAGTGAVGQLQYANRIVTTPYSLLIACISYVVFPAYARISDEIDRFRSAFLRSLRWGVILALPVGVLLGPLGEPLAVIAFGERWREAGEVTAVLCVFIPAQAIAALIGEGFKATGTPATRTWVNVTAVLSGAAAMIALGSAFGLIGVAAGISVDALAGATLAMLLAHRTLRIPGRDLLGTLFAPGVAALVSAAVLVALENLVVHADSHGSLLGLALLCAEGLAGLAVYAATLFAIKPRLARELRRLIGHARRRSRPPARADQADQELLEAERETPMPG